jgi:hypothetical protein
MANTGTGTHNSQASSASPIVGICALSAITAAPAARDAYAAALRAFDWAFQFSDDDAVYRRGRDARARLRAQQSQLDPTGAIWRSIAPEAHGTPQPVIGRAS